MGGEHNSDYLLTNSLAQINHTVDQTAKYLRNGGIRENAADALSEVSVKMKAAAEMAEAQEMQLIELQRFFTVMQAEHERLALKVKGGKLQ